MVFAEAEAAHAFTRQQVDKGQKVYLLQCARCHGPEGQGIKDVYKNLTAPSLIGPDALPLNPRPYQRIRHFQFRNVRDVYEFTSSIMPLDQPASLDPEDYWDVIAYLLDAGGLKTNGATLNGGTAGNISLLGLRQAESHKTPGPPMTNGPIAPVIEGQSRKP
ncbi:MAG: c-type cytochrome [Candidatus Binataceae bacterium]